MELSISQRELDEIVEDSSFNGKFRKFYEMLQNSLDNYTDKQIEKMREDIVGAHKFLGLTPEEVGYDPKELDKMAVIYEYSKLP